MSGAVGEYSGGGCIMEASATRTQCTGSNNFAMLLVHSVLLAMNTETVWALQNGVPLSLSTAALSTVPTNTSQSLEFSQMALVPKTLTPIPRLPSPKHL